MGNRLHPYYHYHWPVADQQAAPKQTSRLLRGGDVMAKTVPRANTRETHGGGGGDGVGVLKNSKTRAFHKETFLRKRQSGSGRQWNMLPLHYPTSLHIKHSFLLHHHTIQSFNHESQTVKWGDALFALLQKNENRKGWEWIIWKRFWRYRLMQQKKKRLP